MVILNPDDHKFHFRYIGNSPRSRVDDEPNQLDNSSKFDSTINSLNLVHNLNEHKIKFVK